MRVSPMLARSTQEFACTSTSFSSTVGTGLRDLLPMLAVAGKAKAVASDDRAILQDDVVAQDAVFAHDSVGMREEMCCQCVRRDR